MNAPSAGAEVLPMSGLWRSLRALFGSKASGTSPGTGGVPPAGAEVVLEVPAMN
jgi:hypothetical protein